MRLIAFMETFCYFHFHFQFDPPPLHSKRSFHFFARNMYRVYNNSFSEITFVNKRIRDNWEWRERGRKGGGRQEHWVYYERIALRIYYKYNRWMKKLLFALDGTSHSDSSNRKTYPIQPNTHTHAHTHIWNDDVGKKFN